MSGAIGSSHVWRPSNARRVVLDGFLPLPRGTVPAAPTLFSWPSKDPADTLDYEIDISEALAGNSGDVVSAVAVSIAPADTLTLGQVAGDGTLAVLWLSGGTAGTTYAVQVTMTTLAGRVIARTILLPVQSLAPAAVPAPTTAILVTGQGTQLTDSSGAPILVSA